MGRLNNKIAIITGAYGGIGKALAKLFAKEGAIVIVTGTSDVKGAKTVEEITIDGGKAEYYHLDVSSEAEWAELVKHIEEKYGRVDVLVNNAGINLGVKLTEYDDAKFDKTFSVNVKGPLYGIINCVPLMKNGGSIVNIDSAAGLTGHFLIDYTTSKWALRGVSKAAALTYAQQNIRVNTICPGVVETHLTQGAPVVELMAKASAMSRSGDAIEVAKAVLFLASDESSYITGIDLPVDGGFIELGQYGQMIQLVRSK